MTPYGGCSATSDILRPGDERFNHNLSKIRTGGQFESGHSFIEPKRFSRFKGTLLLEEGKLTNRKR